MRKSLASGFGVGAALVVVFGSGSAGAINEYVGLTYEKASSSLSSRGWTVVISSRMGDYLPTEQCLVTGSRKASSGSGNRMLLDLNCSDPMTAGHGGYSRSTLEGQKAEALRKDARYISRNYASAVAAGKAPVCEAKYDKCQEICKQAKVCSAELLEYLGS